MVQEDKNLNKLTNDAIKELSSSVVISTDMLTSTHTSIKEVHNTTKQTHLALAQLSAEVEKDLTSLPANVSQAIQHTLRQTLSDFFENQARVENVGTSLVSGDPSISTTFTDHDASQNQASSHHQKVVQQWSTERCYKVWFGTAMFSSLVSKYNPVDDDPEEPKCLTDITTSTWTTITATIDLKIIRLGLLFLSQRHGKILQWPHLDMKLRVFRIVDFDAPIIRACENADLRLVKSLFTSGKASPFDHVVDQQGEMKPILGVVLLAIQQLCFVHCARDASAHLSRIRRLAKLFVLLVEQGLDPGQADLPGCSRDTSRLGTSRHRASPLSALTSWSRQCMPEAMPLLADVARVIVEKSTQNPFSKNDFTEMLWVREVLKLEFPVSSLLLHQEHWEVEWKTATAADNPKDEPRADTAYALLRDPSARAHALFLSLNQDAPEAALTWAMTLFSQVGPRGIWPEKDVELDEAMLCRLALCLYHGLDPRGVQNGMSVVECAKAGNRPDLLREALIRNGWLEEEVDDLFEEESYASLAFQLRNIHHPEKGEGILRMRPISPLRWNEFLGSIDEEARVVDKVRPHEIWRLGAVGVTTIVLILLALLYMF